MASRADSLHGGRGRGSLRLSGSSFPPLALFEKNGFLTSLFAKTVLLFCNLSLI
jgi:hypothetical protein